ncbi:hypothetical protein FEM55_14980 [Dyadobacter sediminis]|uniref:Uncharacterized protein n=2 Tax=Dyadobacter sediminis TaxID=1493691 RepID=A0A5R9KB41_9BACT|nr:hypothetical protein FEM55_14980 [Dyadobacter sediminis]
MQVQSCIQKIMIIEETSSPLSVFDFRVMPKSANTNLSVTRKSEASFFGQDGYLHFAQPGQNWLTYSENATNSAWLKVGTSVSIPGSITAIDGSETGNKIIESSSSGEHRITRELNVARNVPITVSIYLKAATCSRVQLSFSNGSSFKGGNPGVKFNLSNGTFISTSSNVTSYQAINCGNGWWRLKLSGVPDLGTQSGFHLYMLNDSNNTSYSGSTSKFLYAWGAQFEQGTNLSTYTPTTVAPYLGLRFNYDLASLSLTGALIEPATTNSVRYSQVFDNSFWRKENASAVRSGSRSPDGKTYAFKIKENSNSSVHYIAPASNLSTNTDSVYTFSAFLKYSERKWAYFNIIGHTVHFDLANRVIGNRSDVITSASIKNAGNGWVRCSATFKAKSSESSVKIGTEISNGATSYRGDGSSGILIWGAQLEKGSQMTSYIRTNGSTVTRSADIVTLAKPSSSSECDILVQRKDGRTWVNDISGSYQVAPSGTEVQYVNFYDSSETSTGDGDDPTAVEQQLDYTSIGPTGTMLDILSNSYMSQTPSKSWSLQKATNTRAPIYRMQVNAGDRWSGDANNQNRERSEFYSKNNNLPFNKDVWLSFSVRLAEGSSLNLSSGEFCYLGQFHASEDDRDISSAPVLGFKLEGDDTISICTCSTTSNPHTVSPKAVVRGTTRFNRGVWQKIVVRVRFSPTNGQLQWWQNGKQLLNLSGIGIGYPDASGPYWKFGIYRSPMSFTTAVEYANMELEHDSSLYSRVSNPLSIL